MFCSCFHYGMIFTESNTALLLTMFPHLLLLHPLLLILQDPVFLVSSLELAVRPASDTLSHHTHIVLSLTSLGFPYKCQLIIEAFPNHHLLLNKYNSTNFFLLSVFLYSTITLWHAICLLVTCLLPPSLTM